jgi:pyruvate/2-oxoglutarate dehydrogenase complex dihydrolipoamide acyltransferase (E2) component
MSGSGGQSVEAEDCESDGVIIRTRRFLRWLNTPMGLSARWQPEIDHAFEMTWSAGALRTAVERLAAEPPPQPAFRNDVTRDVDLLPALDELAREFAYEYERVRPGSGPDERALLPAAATALARLEEQLHAMSGAANARLWNPAALSGPEWNEVRRLAGRALELLDATKQGAD